jgi:glycosyltransferase involved in cell wall biosynthesis
MKILQIINSLATGGAEKLILETTPLLNNQGIQTDVAVLNGNSYPFLEALKKLKCCAIFSLGTKSVYNPVLIFKIIPYLKKYDIIHVHIFPALYWVALAKMLSFSKTKLVYTEHSTSNNRRKKLIYKIVDRWIYAFYSKIITIAPEVDANIKSHLGFKKDRFILILNGINLKSIKASKPISKTNLLPKLNGDFKILIQVASFRYPKDQKTVIKALKKLGDHVVLLLVGDGPLRPECENLVKTLGLTNRVVFLGIRMDVIPLLKASDIIILSSHHEGLSLASIEGMASGKPFIAADAPGLGDIARNAGLVFPINDDVELAKQINKLLKDKSFYNETVTNCLERASNYNIDKSIDKIVKVYKSLIEI